MKVTITQDDLDTGLSRSYTHDPVCKAIRRAINKKHKVTHDYSVLIPNADYVFIDGAIGELPEQARKFIIELDNKRRPKPITFELEDLPDDFFTTDHRRSHGPSA